MIKQNMKLVKYDLKKTRDGSRNYLNAKFKGTDDKGDFTVSINLDATPENVDMLAQDIIDGFSTDVVYDETQMKSGELNGFEYRYAPMEKNSHYDVLRAFGFKIEEPKKLTKEEYIKKQLEK